MGDIAAQKARAQRLEELSKDPAKGDKITPASQREAEVALQLEENEHLASPIVRDPSGNAEFIDGEGTSWDVKQFHSEQGRFNLEKAVATINRELRAGENIILDTEFLDPNDARVLRSAIEANGWQSQILWSLPE